MTEGRYSSWSELKEIWDARDVRCRRRQEALTAEEVASIRANRRAEVDLLPGDDRGPAIRALMRWTPPHPAETFSPGRVYPLRAY